MTLILIGILSLLVGTVLGFFVSKKAMEKYLKENPPFNENTLKLMMAQMGMKPSQKKLNQVMKAMNKHS